jgi:hypothetical protein
MTPQRAILRTLTASARHAAQAVAALVWLLIVLVDVLANVVLFREWQMVSTTAAEARDRGEAWGCWLCRVLDWIDPDHCDEALADPLGPLD